MQSNAIDELCYQFIQQMPQLTYEMKKWFQMCHTDEAQLPESYQQTCMFAYEQTQNNVVCVCH